MRARSSVASLTILPVLLALALPAAADSPFDALPDDAGAVLYVPSIDAAVAGINKFGKAIGVDDMANLTAQDVNETMFESLEGLDTSKPMLFAIGADGMNSMVIICSLKDVDAWKKSGDVAETGGKFRFTLQGDEWYATLRGQMLIGSIDSDVLADAGNSTGKFAKTFAQPIKALASDEQFLALVDVEAFRSQIDTALIAATAGINAIMGMAASEAGESEELYMAFARWAMSALTRIVGDTERVVVTAGIDGDGVRLRKQVAVKAGPIADYLAKVSRVGKPLLRGLPDHAYWGIMASDWKVPADTPSISEEMMDILATAIKPEDKARFDEFMAGARKAYREATGFNIGMGSSADAGMTIVGTYFTPNPTGYRKLMTEGAEFAQGMMGISKMKMETRLSQDKIAGKEVTAVEYNFASDMPDIEKMLKTMYGDKPTMFAADGAEGMIMAFASEPSARKLMAAALDSSTKELAANPRVKEALGRLSPDPQGLFLLDLGEFLAFSSRMAESMGTGMPEMKLGSPTALVAGSVYLERQAMRAELWVPADPIKKIIAMATAAMGEQSHPME